MTREEILDRYEDAWRQAALENRQHFASGHGETLIEGHEGKDFSCAAFGFKNLSPYQCQTVIQWRCPECSHRMPNARIAYVMVHTNNQHRWTWLTFANKFRDHLAEGERLAAQP